MTLDALIYQLQAIAAEDSADAESTHIKADGLLLEYIGDEEVSRLHDELAPYCA